MINQTLVLFVVLLAGNIRTGLSACDQRNCQAPSESGSLGEVCRESREYLNCIQSMVEVCFVGQITESLEKVSQEALQTAGCGNVTTGLSTCGSTNCRTPGPGSLTEVCRKVQDTLNAFESMLVDCGVREFKEAMKEPFQQAEKFLEDAGCGNARSACNHRNCEAPPFSDGDMIDLCSVSGGYVSCLRSKSEDSDNKELKELVQYAVGELESVLQSELCRTGNKVAADRASSLLLCLGLANLAYFLAKLR